MPTSCLVPDCPLEGSTRSGFCRDHQNRLNARASAYAEYMTDADRIAIAAHPGWRGRPWNLNAIMWADGLHYHASPDHGVGPGYKTAADALAELDRRNGVAPAGEVAALREQLETARSERDLAVKLAEAIRSELAAARAALDKQAATVAALRSELAERDRDVTDLCAERDAYAAELATARRFATTDADTIDNLRTGVRHLDTALTLARRPWWRKVWAWVTGGGA